ncbi:HK97 family phage prohead protease [Cellulosimicrobium sp. 22601]|uniref:HK97 family phage prohead protease n=1 Tax=unclassified Cellulosimicrobium TaxID=2624466 RepID=UPI003F876CAE
MDPELIARAGHSRAQGMAQRADRPRQRRAAEPQGSRAAVHVAGVKMSLRAAGDDEAGPLAFTGYASVYERGYEMWDWYGPYTEIVSEAAGAESLARADLDVPLVLQHQSLRRIARTTNGTLLLAEDETGLRVEAPELDPRDQDVAYIAPKIRAELVDEMSFMFRITLGQWSPDYTEYRIQKYDIHRGDVAIVGYGANPHTGGYPDLRDQVAPQNLRIDLGLTVEDVRLRALV